MIAKKITRALLAVVAAGMFSSAWAAATIVIVNTDGPGEGFNDPFPVAPVGGNPGTTLGQQRLNAFQHAASIWGAQLTSAIPINVDAQFNPLTCTPTGAVLGSAGPIFINRDFPGATLAGTWYHIALAEKLEGADVASPDIRARFNSNLGNPGCLTGTFFYLGLDSPAPAGQVDLIAVLLHEFGHGLGFSTTTNSASGNFFNDGTNATGYPSTYDHFLLDNTQGLGWLAMTAAQRQASAINPRNVVWTGANVTAAAPNVLVLGTPKLQVIEPASIAGEYLVGTATFGPAFETIDLTRQVMPVIESNTLGLACDPLNAANSSAVKNRIAMVFRGVCGFIVKVKNAQNAGARGVIVVDNVAGSPPVGLGGVDPTITIPSIRVSFADGVTLFNAMQFNNPSGRTVNEKVRFFNNFSQLAGADELDRVMIFTPNPVQGGSSVSHWDTSATRNLLMEPAINPDLTQSVKPPEDLTLPMFKDLGW